MRFVVNCWAVWIRSQASTHTVYHKARITPIVYSYPSRAAIRCMFVSLSLYCDLYGCCSVLETGIMKTQFRRTNLRRVEQTSQLFLDLFYLWSLDLVINPSLSLWIVYPMKNSKPQTIVEDVHLITNEHKQNNLRNQVTCCWKGNCVSFKFGVFRFVNILKHRQDNEMSVRRITKRKSTKVKWTHSNEQWKRAYVRHSSTSNINFIRI